MQDKLSIYDLSLREIEAWLQRKREPSYRAKQVSNWLYKRRASRFQEMSDLPESLRQVLEGEYRCEPLQCLRQTGSKDLTRKFLFALPDQMFIESVLIPARPALYGSATDRRTICISTQVGCAFGCKFCASGLEGWTRNLAVGEIVQQALQVESLSGEKINNIVFMGMGEPLANYDNLLKAIEIINGEWGIGIGARHITVSTSGLVPRIKQLAEQPLQIRLAISLHGATDEIRQKIMPINRRFNIASLVDACAYYRQRKRQKLTLEYILIDQLNDQLDQAMELSRLAKRLEAKVNLIPYNVVEGLQWARPSETRQQFFLRALRKNGVDATIRREKGHDINAACGQLRLQAIRDKSFAASSNLR
jgi:23S rRNA (adenine2503-C2)-methyltransferase